MAKEETAASREADELTFEQAMVRLEAIVNRLESGDVPLETAIELYQEGMRLSRLCARKLEEVERRIEMLVEDEQGLQRRPFHPDADENNGTGKGDSV